MFFRIVAISFLAVTIISAQNNNAACRDANGLEGDCRQVKTCNSAVKILGNPPISPENLNYLRKSQCGNENRTPLICCINEMVTEVQVPVTTTTSSVSESELSSDLTSRYSGAGKLPKAPFCGVDVQDKIFGGTDTKLDEFPWLAQIGYDKPFGAIGFHCGGTLINQQYVLTAAHCVAKIPKTWKLSTVRLGEWDTTTAEDCDDSHILETICAPPHKDFRVIQKIVHQKYTFDSNNHNDIALLKLGTKVVYTDWIKPICMPLEPSLRSSTFNAVSMNVAGWGKTETSSTSERKLKVQITTFKNEDCAKIYGRQNIQILDSQICAGGERGKDSCNGDSGGPMMRMNEKGIASYWFQVGIVSFGPKNCGLKNVPGVYTRVSKYIDWIEANIK